MPIVKTSLDAHDAAGLKRDEDDYLIWVNPHPNPDLVRKQRDNLVLFLLEWLDGGPEHDANDLRADIRDLLTENFGVTFDYLGPDPNIYSVIKVLEHRGIIPPRSEDDE